MSVKIRKLDDDEPDLTPNELRRSTARGQALAAQAIIASAPFKTREPELQNISPTEPEPPRPLTNAEVLDMLSNAPDSQRHPGRTLLKGLQYDGRDIPGRGKAAARRLRQLQKKQNHG